MSSPWLLLVLGVTLSVDNLRVALALGAAGVNLKVALRLAVAFALFEGLMPLLGLVIGHSVAFFVEPWASVLGAGTLALTGLYIVVNTVRGGNTQRLLDRTWLIVGLPLSLSFDNLAAGFGLALLGLPVVASALSLGVASGLVCFVGFRLGAWMGGVLPRRAQLASGILLVGIAGLSLTG